MHSGSEHSSHRTPHTRRIYVDVITGPTAVGKSEAALRVAELIGAEILSCDSRQIYRLMDIGTAKPTPEDRARIAHHFIDELDPNAYFSAGEFARQATERIYDMAARGKHPLIVGGSTLYLHALQNGLADIPPVDASVRAHLTERLQTEGLGALFAELQRVDPDAAAAIPPNNRQRVIRALEVFHGTGSRLSDFRPDPPQDPFTFRVFVFHRDREALYARINRRVDEMLIEGLVDEVQGILDRGYSPELNALQTIGYREVISFLENRSSYEEMAMALKQNSRRYAKRQLTWFRRYPDYRWVDATSVDPTALAAEMLATRRF